MIVIEWPDSQPGGRQAGQWGRFAQTGYDVGKKTASGPSDKPRQMSADISAASSLSAPWLGSRCHKGQKPALEGVVAAGLRRQDGGSEVRS